MDGRADDRAVDLLSPAFLGVIALGVATGAVSGTLGVGGATLSTPGVRLLGATPAQAVGSTLPALLPSAIAGALRYARAGLVDWRVAGLTGGAGAVVGMGGAWLSGLVDARTLMVLTALVLLGSGLAMARRSDDADAADRAPADEPTGPLAGGAGGTVAVAVRASRTTASTGAALGVGAVTGFVAGLLGLGGGVVLMPLLTGVLAVPVKRAVGTSLVAVALLSVPALAVHTMLGHVDWVLALGLALGVVPGARLGARFTLGASERAVQLLFGAFLVLLAIVFGATELAPMLATIG